MTVTNKLASPKATPFWNSGHQVKSIDLIWTKVKLKVESDWIGLQWIAKLKLKVESDWIGLQWIALYSSESPGTTDWDPLARAIRPLPSTSRTQKIKKDFFLYRNIFFTSRGFCLRAESRGIKPIKQDIEGDQSNISGGPSCGSHWQTGLWGCKSLGNGTIMGAAEMKNG